MENVSNRHELLTANDGRQDARRVVFITLGRVSIAWSVEDKRWSIAVWITSL